MLSEVISKTSRLRISIYSVCEGKVYIVHHTCGAKYFGKSRRCLSDRIWEHSDECSSLNEASFHCIVIHARKIQVCTLKFDRTRVIGGSSRTLWWRTHWGNCDTGCYPNHCYTIHFNDYEKISVSNARAHPHVSVTVSCRFGPFSFYSLLIVNNSPFCTRAHASFPYCLSQPRLAGGEFCFQNKGCEMKARTIS